MSYDLSDAELAQAFEDLRAAKRTIVELEAALDKERADKKAVADIFCRMVNWLRGEDHQFSKLILEFRDQLKASSRKEAR